MIVGNVHLAARSIDNSGCPTADADAAALAGLRQVPGHSAAGHGESCCFLPISHIQAAACLLGGIAGDIAAGDVQTAGYYGKTATAMGAAALGAIAVTAPCLVLIIGNVSSIGQVDSCTAGGVDASAIPGIYLVDVNCSAWNRIPGNHAAGQGEDTAVHADAATSLGGICRNHAAGHIDSTACAIDTAAPVVWSAAADNIAALHGQRSALHQDYPFAAAVPERTALDDQCTSVDLNRLVRAFIAPDCAGEGNGMLFQRFRRAGTIGCGFRDVIRQGVAIQAGFIAVKCSAGIGHSVRTGCRVHDGKGRTIFDFKVLVGLFDIQAITIQINRSVL